MSSSEEPVVVSAADKSLVADKIVDNVKSCGSAEVQQQPPAEVLDSIPPNLSTSAILPAPKVESSFDLSSLKGAVEAQSDHTPDSVYSGLVGILATDWNEEDIADLVNKQFGDSVRVYKKEGDRIDSLRATIFAFHFCDNDTGKHHVLYSSKDKAFMRTKILHYFVPFSGPFLADEDQKSIFEEFFEGVRQSMKGTDGKWVSYHSNQAYQRYVRSKEFPLSAYVSYDTNELVSNYGYTLVTVAPKVKTVKKEPKGPEVKKTI